MPPLALSLIEEIEIGFGNYLEKSEGMSKLDRVFSKLLVGKEVNPFHEWIEHQWTDMKVKLE